MVLLVLLSIPLIFMLGALITQIIWNGIAAYFGFKSLTYVASLFVYGALNILKGFSFPSNKKE